MREQSASEPEVEQAALVNALCGFRSKTEAAKLDGLPFKPNSRRKARVPSRWVYLRMVDRSRASRSSGLSFNDSRASEYVIQRRSRLSASGQSLHSLVTVAS